MVARVRGRQIVRDGAKTEDGGAAHAAAEAGRGHG